jgi:nucleoside-diphosphate-sugar epimerase
MAASLPARVSMRVLVIGASGFLGGAIALRLLRDGHRVAALVRGAGRAEPMQKAGIETRPGSLDDAASLKAAADDTDAIVNAADSDHRAGVEAIIAAVAGTGKTFVHTSGISVTADCAAGAASDVVRDEDTPFEPIPERRERFAIDQAVRGASERGCRTIVMCCPLAYGPPAWPGRESVQVPHLVRDARARGVARYVGAGEARWSHCHIDDIADAYSAALVHGWAGALYYPENGEFAWGELAARIGRIVGVPSASWSLEEAVAAWGARALWTYSSNARTRGVRIRADLGWKPRIEDMDADIRRLSAMGT